LERQIGELAGILQVSQDHLDLADHQLEEVDAFVQDREDALLDRAREAEGEYLDRVLLPDPVQAPNALLEPHRVPGDVEVEHAMAELEVQPLAADVGREQHAPCRPAAFDRLRTFTRGLASVEALVRNAGPPEYLGKEAERAAEAREDDRRLIGPGKCAQERARLLRPGRPLR